MTTVLDFINEDLTTIDAKFKNIQIRYFDPFSISITTETNKQVWFSEYLNRSFDKVFGSNIIIDGIVLQSIEDNSDNYTLVFNKGLLRVDSVFIEITDNIRLIIPKNSDTNLSGDITQFDNYLLVFIEYKFVKTYPYNFAKIRFKRLDDLINHYNTNIPIVIIGSIYKDDSGSIRFFPIDDTLDIPDNITNIINSVKSLNNTLGEQNTCSLYFYFLSRSI